MQIIIGTDSYNTRRDGAPWIYKIGLWEIGKKLPVVAELGVFIGERGAAGSLEINAEPGDIIRWGQNDLRRQNHTYRQYGLVRESGEVTKLSDSEARALALKSPAERVGASDPEALAACADQL